MKRKSPYILLLALAAITMVGCSKEKQCQCTAINPTEDGIYNKYLIDADKGFKCKSVTRIGVEKLNEGNLERTMVEVTCEEAK